MDNERSISPISFLKYLPSFATMLHNTVWLHFPVWHDMNIARLFSVDHWRIRKGNPDPELFLQETYRIQWAGNKFRCVYWNITPLLCCTGVCWPHISLTLNKSVRYRHRQVLWNKSTPWLMEPAVSMSHSQGSSNNLHPESNQPISSYWYLFL